MKSLLFLLALAVPLTLGPVAGAQNGPVETPFTEDFDDLNPCTGEMVTYTFTGVARVIERQENSILVARGTVVTSDGFSGSFNRQQVFIGERVVHMRFHDMEVSHETGERIMFGVGMIHETMVDGDTVVSFLQFSGLRCVGRNN